MKIHVVVLALYEREIDAGIRYPNPPDDIRVDLTELFKSIPNRDNPPYHIDGVRFLFRHGRALRPILIFSKESSNGVIASGCA